MRYFLIADNHDTVMGMRFAGVDGVIAHEKDEVAAALQKAKSDENIGILIITEKIAKLCPDMIYDLKLNSSRPLLVEIPDRHGTGRTPDSITKYIREAIGIKL